VNITITGPRDVVGIEMKTFGRLFRTFLAPFDGSQTTWLVGGAAGLDTIALHWLWLEGRGHVMVIVPDIVNNQPHESVDMIRNVQLHAPERLSVIELEHENFPMPNSFHDRNHYMVDASDLVIGFPHRTKKCNGTRATLQYAMDRGVARLVYELE
jgi:hypothetical protein